MKAPNNGIVCNSCCLLPGSFPTYNWIECRYSFHANQLGASAMTKYLGAVKYMPLCTFSRDAAANYNTSRQKHFGGTSLDN